MEGLSLVSMGGWLQLDLAICREGWYVCACKKYPGFEAPGRSE